jgi:uncharacterized membrane protein
MNPEMRASDADRERVVTVLREGVGTGRLTLDEFSQRCDTTYGSRTVGELDTLVRDLPRPVPAPAVAAVRPNLLPVFAVLAVVLVVLAVTLFVLSDSGALNPMGQMMGR